MSKYNVEMKIDPRRLTPTTQIRTALTARSYLCINSQDIGCQGENISWWSDGEHICILHEYQLGMGCELYVQGTRRNSVEAVIRAIPMTGEVFDRVYGENLIPSGDGNGGGK